MKPVFFSIQGSYKQIEIALFRGLEELYNIKEENLKASSRLIPSFVDILQSNSLSLGDVKFISLDQGPGAFTSLRVLISTINGIGFARDVPLIGINGLEALACETLSCIKKQDNYPIIIPLLNAFNNDVYFAVYEFLKGNLKLLLPAGYKNIDHLLEELRGKFGKREILFSGSGASLFNEKIKTVFKYQAITSEKFSLVASAKQIGIMGLERWEKKEGLSSRLLPIYLKIQKFKPKYSIAE